MTGLRVGMLLATLSAWGGGGLQAAGAGTAPGAAAQEAPPTGEAPQEALSRPITVTFVDTPIRDALFTFAEFAGRSIVTGADVSGSVSAEIRDQPWDVALGTLLDAYGLVSRDQGDGIILVERAGTLLEHDASLPLATTVLRPTFIDAGELQNLALPLLTERGRASIGPGANALVVTDIPRVLEGVAELATTVDVPVGQVDIAARIIFVNRTGLAGFGITYDLKDVEGNQLNVLTPGFVDLDGDGGLSLPEEQVPVGTNVVSLGGSSLAALGNAADRISNPSLSLLASLVAGRTTLVAFVSALESAQLTEVEAEPSVRVMDNRTARVVVGEETPVRVLDAGAQVQAGTGGDGRGAFPVATVDYKETGVILEVVPRITSDGRVLLNLSAERSSADLAPSDVGFVFRRQKAESQVLVENGETVVIGGLTVREAADVRSGIPLLMDLPLVGRLFRSYRESSVQRDLLIMVTPTIVGSASP